PDVRVAVIDDGVNANESSLYERVAHNGWPRQHPTSSQSPWYQSFSGHGTEIAKLICSVCPFVKLYIAKLDFSGGPSTSALRTAKSAVAAIKWAVSQEVHVILISWPI
ncbi:uncharacterized protein K444DRAFT_479844, partial [Hyaloscypha bicolor E]